MGSKIVLISLDCEVFLAIFKVALFGIKNFKIYDASIFMKQFNMTRYWKISKQYHCDVYLIQINILGCVYKE